ILTNCKQDDLVNALVAFRGLRTDVATLVHGDSNYIVLNGPKGLMSMTAYEVGLIKNFKPTLGVVFQQNCWGGNDVARAWITAGAQAVTGTRKINEKVLAYNEFFEAWTRGATFGQAVSAANRNMGLDQRILLAMNRFSDKAAELCCAPCRGFWCTGAQKACRLATGQKGY